MKTSFFKFIFLSTLIALAAIGCTNDEIHSGTDDGKVAARISADVQQTRATNAIWNENDAIGVAMINPKTSGVIDPYRNYGYTTSGDGQFSPIDAGHIIYFPTNDEEVTFRSYYPYKKDLSPELVIPVSTKDQTALADIDLMTAEHLSGTSTKDPNVKLHFHHRLAKVVVNLSADGPRESILNGAKLVMKGLKTDATYNLLYEELKVNDASGADVSIPVSSAKSEAIVLPRAAGAGVSFEITTPDGGKYTAAMGSDLELKAGYVHTFNIRLKSPAEISATIEPWTEGPTRRYDVIRVVTGLEETKGFATGNVLDLFLKDGNATDFSLLNKFTYNGTLWTPDAPVYWESIAGDPVTFRGATVIDKALNSTQMDDILISKDVDVKAYTGVNLEMEHAGSKVTIQLQSSDGTYTATDLKNATVVLPDYLNAGSYNDKGEFVPGTTRGNITPENNVAVFPPQTIANGNIANVVIKGRTYDVPVPAEGLEYIAGTAYKIILDIKGSGILISTTIIDWVPGADISKTVQIGTAGPVSNSGDLRNGDQLYLYTDGTAVSGHFKYTGGNWNYSESTPLHWESIANTGKIYASITRPEVNATPGHNQSKDYITAEPAVNHGGKDNTVLSLNLHHRVAKVNVKLTSSFYTDEQLNAAIVSLPGHTIGGAVVNGVYNTDGSSTGTITVGPLSNTEASAYLQPQIITSGATVAVVKLPTAGNREYPVIHTANVEYKAGHYTNLTINIEPSDLKVSVNVADWGKIEHNFALSFHSTDASASGFEDDDLIKFYKLNGNNVAGNTKYKYTGNAASGSLAPETGAPTWFRDDFQTGDRITAVFPADKFNLESGNTFDWTAEDGTASTVTNARLDDILVAAPDANNGVIKDGSANVSLHFKHVLSKVTVNLFNGDGFTKNDLSGSTIKLLNFILKGTVNVADGKATATGTPVSFAPTGTAPNTVSGLGEAVSSYEAFIFPQKIGKVGSKTALVEVTLNEQKYNAEIELYYDFKAGENHVFNITLKKTGLVFSATVAPWENGTGGSIIIR
ncbi:fimbrillin family protein [Limibacterium fermenti]|uniref:fimbrillin family protein n=1 Tax=Limibacterium fermenti TaxID=3229863 RepID=UPI003A61C05C